MPIEVAAAPETSAPSLEKETVETPQAASATPAPAGAEDASPPSPEETAVSEFDRHLAKSQGKPEPEQAKTTGQTETPEPEVPDADGKPEVKPDVLSQPESEKGAPFKDRPEWQKLVKLVDPLSKEAGAEVRQTLRQLYQKGEQLQQEVEKAKPSVEWVEHFTRETGGGEAGVKNTLAFFRTFNHDPAKAVPFLENALADARKRAGLVIQSPDLVDQQKQLEQAVAEGAITPEQAEQRKKELTELETSRATLKRTTAQTEAERQQVQQRQQAEVQQAEMTAIDQAEASWTEAKTKADPDFPTVKPLFDKFAQLGAVEFNTANKRMPKPDEARQILEKAYADAKAEAMKFQPRRAAKTPVRDEGTSRNTRQQPVTAEEKFNARFDKALKRN